MPTAQEKLKALEDRIGKDKFDSLMNQVMQSEKEADADKIAYKELANVSLADATPEQLAQAFKLTEKAAKHKMDYEDDEDEDFEDEEDDILEDEDMPKKKGKTSKKELMAQAMQPMTVKEMKDAEITSGFTLAQVTPTELQTLVVDALQNLVQTTQKEAQSNLIAELDTIKKKLNRVYKELQDITGNASQPTFRPSVSNSTITQTAKEEQPVDGFGTLLDMFTKK